MKNKTNFILILAIFLFAVFVAYQIVLIILGGSWASQDAILAFVLMNVGISVYNARICTGNKHDIKHLSNSFKALSQDFKHHINDREIH